MYLCLCNGVNERTVRDLIRKDKLRTAKQVYKVIGPLQCGKCTSYINKYIDKDKEGLL
jgi:bacterioferritin-associated ferredoxin